MEPIAELEDDDEEGYTYYSPTLRQQMNKQLQEQQQHFQDSMMERDLVDESSDNGQGGGGRGGGGDGESPSRTMMSSPGEVQFLKLQSQQQHHHHHQQQPRSASANQMMGNGSGSGGGSSQDNLNNLCNNGRGSGNNLSLDESDGSASTGNGVPFRTRSNTWPQQCSAIISLDYDDEGGAVPPTDSTTEMDSGGHGDGARAPPRFESMVSGDSFDQDDEKDGVQLLSHHHGGRPLSTGTSSSNQSSLANLTSLATVTCLHGQHQQQSTTSSSAGHADSNGTPPSSESTPNAEQSFYQMDPFYGHHHLHHHHQEHAHHPQHLSYQQQQQQQQNDMDVPLLVDPIYSHSTPHSSTSSLMHPFGQQQQQQHNHHHHGDHATPTHDPYQLLTSPLGSSVYGNMFANYSSQQDVAADLVGAAIHHQQQQQQQLLHSDLQMDMMVVEGGVDGGDLVAASQQAEAAVAAAAAMAALKKNTSRRNAWGNMSYADLITQAINGAPDNRLTLSQIYEWMVQNVAYFKDKGDSNSSAGWKNSIRHNLSLHNRFMRVQNEGTGKSSWWMINPEAKPGKAARRRAISMETQNCEKRRGRVKRKVEQIRLNMRLGQMGSGGGAGAEGGNKSGNHVADNRLGEYPVHSTNSSLLSLSSSSGNPYHSSTSSFSSPGEFRPRTSSNASTCSALNLGVIDLDNQQVSPHSPWNDQRQSYGPHAISAGSSNNINIYDQLPSTGLVYGPPPPPSSSSSLPLNSELIDCLANLQTGGNEAKDGQNGGGGNKSGHFSVNQNGEGNNNNTPPSTLNNPFAMQVDQPSPLPPSGNEQANDAQDDDDAVNSSLEQMLKGTRSKGITSTGLHNQNQSIGGLIRSASDASDLLMLNNFNNERFAGNSPLGGGGGVYRRQDLFKNGSPVSPSSPHHPQQQQQPKHHHHHGHSHRHATNRPAGRSASIATSSKSSYLQSKLEEIQKSNSQSQIFQNSPSLSAAAMSLYGDDQQQLSPSSLFAHPNHTHRSMSIPYGSSSGLLDKTSSSPFSLYDFGPNWSGNQQSGNEQQDQQQQQQLYNNQLVQQYSSLPTPPAYGNAFSGSPYNSGGGGGGGGFEMVQSPIIQGSASIASMAAATAAAMQGHHLDNHRDSSQVMIVDNDENGGGGEGDMQGPAPATEHLIELQRSSTGLPPPPPSQQEALLQMDSGHHQHHHHNSSNNVVAFSSTSCSTSSISSPPPTDPSPSSSNLVDNGSQQRNMFMMHTTDPMMVTIHHRPQDNRMFQGQPVHHHQQQSPASQPSSSSPSYSNHSADHASNPFQDNRRHRVGQASQAAAAASSSSSSSPNIMMGPLPPPPPPHSMQNTHNTATNMMVEHQIHFPVPYVYVDSYGEADGENSVVGVAVDNSGGGGGDGSADGINYCQLDTSSAMTFVQGGGRPPITSQPLSSPPLMPLISRHHSTAAAQQQKPPLPPATSQPQVTLESRSWVH